MASLGCAASLLAVALLALPASAQTDEERDQARQLMDHGDELADEKMHIEALDAYRKAHAIMHVPTTGIEVVRMLLSLGRLIEAKQVCAEVVGLPIQPDEPTAFADARKDADQLATELEARIPRLRVRLPASSKLYVDGAEHPEVSDGEPFAIDPGPHALEARSATNNVTKHIRIEEREHKLVDLTPPKPKRSVLPPKRSSASTVARPIQRSHGNTTRILGWTGIGIGGAGIVFGSITGVLAMRKRSDLDAAGCVDGSCPSGRAEDVDSYNRLRTFSGAGLIGGAVFATAGALLLGFGGDSSARTGRTAWPRGAQLTF